MSRATFPTPRRASRIKVGFSVLAGVFIALAAGQIAAAPNGAIHSSIHGATR